MYMIKPYQMLRPNSTDGYWSLFVYWLLSLKCTHPPPVMPLLEMLLPGCHFPKWQRAPPFKAWVAPRLIFITHIYLQEWLLYFNMDNGKQRFSCQLLELLNCFPPENISFHNLRSTHASENQFEQCDNVCLPYFYHELVNFCYNLFKFLLILILHALFLTQNLLPCWSVFFAPPY